MLEGVCVEVFRIVGGCKEKEKDRITCTALPDGCGETAAPRTLCGPTMARDYLSAYYIARCFRSILFYPDSSVCHTLNLSFLQSSHLVFILHLVSVWLITRIINPSFNAF